MINIDLSSKNSHIEIPINTCLTRDIKKLKFAKKISKISNFTRENFIKAIINRILNSRSTYFLNWTVLHWTQWLERILERVKFLRISKKKFKNSDFWNFTWKMRNLTRFWSFQPDFDQKWLNLKNRDFRWKNIPFRFSLMTWFYDRNQKLCFFAQKWVILKIRTSECPLKNFKIFSHRWCGAIHLVWITMHRAVCAIYPIEFTTFRQRLIKTDRDWSRLIEF